MKSLLACLAAFCLAAAPLAAQTDFVKPLIAGQAIASQFNWRIGATVQSTAGGSGVITFDLSYIVLPDSTQYTPWQPGLPVTIQDGASTETVTLTSVSCSSLSGQACTATANFQFAHDAHLQVVSGTAGLQEAIDLVNSHGGGTVIADPAWTGASAQIAAAAGAAGVLLEDDRNGRQIWYAWNGSAFAPQLNLNAADAALTLQSVNGVLDAAQNGGVYSSCLKAAPAGQIVELPQGDVETLTVNTVIPPACVVQVDAGALIRLAGFSFAGYVRAGDWKIFDLSGGGSVNLNDNLVNPAWFGAAGSAVEGTVTTTAGSSTATLGSCANIITTAAAVCDFSAGQGFDIPHAGATSALLAPTFTAVPYTYSENPEPLASLSDATTGCRIGSGAIYPDHATALNTSCSGNTATYEVAEVDANGGAGPPSSPVTITANVPGHLDTNNSIHLAITKNGSPSAYLIYSCYTASCTPVLNAVMPAITNVYWDVGESFGRDELYGTALQAGATGDDLQGTISSVSGSTITLSTPARQTGSFLLHHDDSAALLAAIKSVAASPSGNGTLGGGTVQGGLGAVYQIGANDFNIYNQWGWNLIGRSQYSPVIAYVGGAGGYAAEMNYVFKARLSNFEFVSPSSPAWGVMVDDLGSPGALNTKQVVLDNLAFVSYGNLQGGGGCIAMEPFETVGNGELETLHDIDCHWFSYMGFYWGGNGETYNEIQSKTLDTASVFANYIHGVGSIKFKNTNEEFNDFGWYTDADFGNGSGTLSIDADVLENVQYAFYEPNSPSGVLNIKGSRWMPHPGDDGYAAWLQAPMSASSFILCGYSATTCNIEIGSANEVFNGVLFGNDQTRFAGGGWAATPRNLPIESSATNSAPANFSCIGCSTYTNGGATVLQGANFWGAFNAANSSSFKIPNSWTNAGGQTVSTPAGAASNTVVPLASAAAHEWVSYADSGGVQHLAQPAFSDISGVLASAQCPAPNSATPGCIESAAPVAHQWLAAISTAGVPSLSQPAAADLSDGITGSGHVVLAISPALSSPALTAPAIGGETISSSPRILYSAFVPALTSTLTAADWIPDKAITVTRLQAQAQTAPAGCTTNAVVQLTDGASPLGLAIAAAAADSGPISQNYSAGASLALSVSTAAAGCTINPANLTIIVQYRMQ